MTAYRKLRVIISGGGTGGHIFPAVSIANKLKEVNPETEILFVGAEGKMEMEKVPAAGYEIVGLPIVGLQRQLNLKNIVNDLKVPFKILQSIHKAGKVIDEFKPDIAIGVGGYASAPLLWKATAKKVPALIQEQNGFAGLTNKLLAKRVGSICVAYDERPVVTYVPAPPPPPRPRVILPPPPPPRPPRPHFAPPPPRHAPPPPRHAPPPPRGDHHGPRR